LNGVFVYKPMQSKRWAGQIAELAVNILIAIGKG